MFDCHVHSSFSADCRTDIKDIIKKGKESEIGITITDHIDVNFPGPTEFLFNFDDYFNEYTKYRNDRLLIGVEMGMQDCCCEENRKAVDKYPFDCVIGSVHLIYGKDICDKGTYAGRSKRDIYEMYFRCMLDCLKNYDFIDSMGHIDYIARYAPYEDREIYYDEFSDYIDSVLKILIERGQSIEINSRRFGDRKVHEHLAQIYRRFHELGGKTVTLGSDSHMAEGIGKHFDTSNEIAESCGLKVVHYKQRQPQYI
jgi:histidinol-phosphatase (PHP family)